MNSWTFMCHQDSSVGEGSEIQTLIGQRNNLEMVDQTPPWSNVIQHPCISNMIPTRIGFMHNHQIMDALGQIQVALLQHKGKATLQRIEQQWCNPIASAWNPAVQGTKLAAKTTNQIQTPEISAWPAERSPFKNCSVFSRAFSLIDVFNSHDSLATIDNLANFTSSPPEVSPEATHSPFERPRKWRYGKLREWTQSIMLTPWVPSRELTYPQKLHFEDDFPFPKLGYVSSLEGKCYCTISIAKPNNHVEKLSVWKGFFQCD